MSIYINPDDLDFRIQIMNLQPTPGYCFFFDIVGSTELKDEGLSQWILFIYNTFSNIRSYLFFKFRPLKSLGDGLLFFIPESEMKGETPLILFNSLCQILNSIEPYLRDVKIGAAYCKKVYDITFIKNSTDIYGKEIDLTARLASFAGRKELLMNGDFVERIRACYETTGNKENFKEVQEIIGPWPAMFKGFNNYVNIYKLIKK